MSQPVPTPWSSTRLGTARIDTAPGYSRVGNPVSTLTVQAV